MIQIFLSDKPSKRFVAVYNDKKYYFGQPNANTYIDGTSETTRANYWKRHMANKTEKQRIDNLIMSPALLSAYILWGDYRDINKNTKYLEQMLINEL
jgi:hypothetical protein